MNNIEHYTRVRLTGIMSRRSFFKGSIHILVWISSISIGRTARMSPSQAHTYGAGVYGQGLYVGGYRAYLPLLTQEGD